MVRFHWHVESGQHAYIPPGGVEQDQQSNLLNVKCEMELSGQTETAKAHFTVPANYTSTSDINPIGIILAHGSNAYDWNSPLLEQIAQHYAKKDHVVMRYSKQKERHRLRILQKAIHTAMTSPYARDVKSWVLVGHENGARVTALVAPKCRASFAGYIFLSYPLLEPPPRLAKQKAGTEPPSDSIGPLLRLTESDVPDKKAPMLFVSGELDYNCPGADLKKLDGQLGDVDARAVIINNVDANFIAPKSSSLAPKVSSQILTAIDTFITNISTSGNLADSKLPHLSDIVPSKRVPPRPVSPVEEESDGDDDDQDVQDAQQQQNVTGTSAANMAPALLQQLQFAMLQQQMALAQQQQQSQVTITMAPNPGANIVSGQQQQQ